MSSPCLLATVESGSGLVGRWSPGIGDPTFAGWLTTVAYFVTSVLCLRAYRRRRPIGPADGVTAARAWLLLSAALFALGINKQLDLQTMFSELGRGLALSQGWYNQRRVVQLVFVALTVTVAALVAWRAARLARSELFELRLALVGVILLVGFILVRASSFHAVDWLLGRSWKSVRLNSLLELSGIGCVLVSALQQGKSRREAPRT